MSPRLQVNLQKKSFAGRAVIRNVAFDVDAGEIVALLGASGCGKSTLLRAIAGLDRAFDGNIAIHGTHNDQNVIGMVYQEPRLLPWLTVEENIGFGINIDSRKSSIDGLLDEVLLEKAGGYLPKELSGGMAQRVAIARALLREPDVLLMDEPFSALDVLTRRSLHSLTRKVTAKHQTATVIVTHDPEEAVNLADRVLVLLNEGIDGATIRHDIRPGASKSARLDDIEAIIAALDAPPPTKNLTLYDHYHHNTC